MRQLDELSQIESLLLGHRQPVEGEDRFCHEVAPDMFNTQDIMHGNRATLDVYSKHYFSHGITYKEWIFEILMLQATDELEIFIYLSKTQKSTARKKSGSAAVWRRESSELPSPNPVTP